MTRSAHFVGSLPPDVVGDDRATLQWFADVAHRYPVTAIPCDIDPNWILTYLQDLALRPAFTVARQGRFVDYSDMPIYQVRRGHTLTVGDVSMNRRDRIVAIATHYAQLQIERPELAVTPLQVSLPNPLDMALFAFAGGAVEHGLPIARALAHPSSLATALRHLPVFTRAVLDEVDAVTEAIGRFRLVWQLESPVATLASLKAHQLHASRMMVPMLARQVAGMITELYGRNAATTLHLCWGDYGHRQLLTPDSVGPVVALLNATAAALRRRNTPAPPVHIPCAFGAEPAPLDPSFYAPLTALDCAWDVIAGVVSPERGGDIEALELFETAAGRRASAVATACGFGRCTAQGAALAAQATIRAAGAQSMPMFDAATSIAG